MRLAVAGALGLLATAAIWLVFFGIGPATRALAYDAAAPRYWPVIYNLEFNGANPVPGRLNSVWWTGDVGYGDGSSISTSIPTARPRDVITIEAHWIEWATGRLWHAQIAVDHPDALNASLTAVFGADGALTIYRPGPELQAGSLGRMATHDDYEEIGHICGTPLPPDDPIVTHLRQAREANLYIDVARIAEAGYPDPPASRCSAATQ